MSWNVANTTETSPSNERAAKPPAASSSIGKKARNHLKLVTRLSGRCRYAFVDVDEHRADRILIGALIPVSFERPGSIRRNDGFELRICSFERKYETWFLNCMSDLEWVIEGTCAESYARACETLLG